MPISAGGANPFVIGKPAYQRFSVMPQGRTKLSLARDGVASD